MVAAALLCLLAVSFVQPLSAQRAPGAAATRPFRRHRRNDFQPGRRPADGRRAGQVDARRRALRPPHARAVRQRGQQRADARAVAAACSKRVNEVFATDKELAGIVVTSGTDTLEETAFFLHLTVRDPRPVVVVGSMRNPSTLGYEGAANLLEGVRVAADPAVARQGRAGRAQRRDQFRAQRDQDRRAAAADVPEPRVRPARRRRSRSRRVLQPDHAAAHRAERVRRHQGHASCRAST